MSTAWGGVGGGGGGFGGFPHRGSHQQGTDGRGRGGRGQRRRKPRKKPPRLSCAADLMIPANNRGRLIGKGGATIRELRSRTGASIYVPSDNRRSNNHDAAATNTIDTHPVRIKAESVASLLYVCWEISHLLLLEEAACQVRVPSTAPSLEGRLVRGQDRFLVGNHDDAAANHSMSAFCIESFLDDANIDTLVDNERFSHPNVTARYEAVDCQSEGYPTTLIFVYGSPEQQPEQLYQVLKDATLTLWTETCFDIITPVPVVEENGTALTVGTYNLLHPMYAKKYNDAAGLSRSGQCNWTLRGPAIVRMLLKSNLDIYFLQECSTLPEIDRTSQQYKCIHFGHPSREAGDSVAIWIRQERFVVEQTEMAPFLSKQDSDGHYMCAATAIVRDTTTGVRYLLASTHFYSKKSLHPEATLLEYLKGKQDCCDAIIWGGDCNDEYKGGPPEGFSCLQEGRPTKGISKRIDWIFYTPALKASRSAASEAFVDATRVCLDPTGNPPSDHFGEAITLRSSAEV